MVIKPDCSTLFSGSVVSMIIYPFPLKKTNKCNVHHLDQVTVRKKFVTFCLLQKMDFSVRCW